MLMHVSKSYGDHHVIQDLSQTFSCGQITCLMAPSGSGKTTLLRLLMGLEVPDSGSIAGLEGRKKSAVFQEQIFGEDLSVYANIRIMRKRKLFESESEKQEYERIKAELEKDRSAGMRRSESKGTVFWNAAESGTCESLLCGLGRIILG